MSGTRDRLTGRGSGGRRRREVLAAGAAGALSLGLGCRATAQDLRQRTSSEPPYPWASTGRLERVDANWLWREGLGSDQWPHVALDDNRLLAAWGDGWGWSGRGGEEHKARMGVTEISGSMTDPSGVDLWGDRSMRMKPCGLGVFGGDVLLFATSDEDSRDRTVALISEGGGRAWSRIPGSVLSRSQHGLQVVGTAGQRPGVAADRLVVYLAADGNLRTDDLYARERNQTIWAAFIDRDMVASINGWPFFAGEATGEEGARQVTVDETLALATRADRRTGLTSNAAVTTLALPGGTAGGLEAQPVFVDPAGAGKHFLVSWCPSTNSYIAAKTHERTGLGLFSSATPWGPWETLWYGPFVERGAIFTAQVVTMWSTDGTVALMWSGSPDTNASHNLDAVYLTRFSVGQEQELSVPGLRRSARRS